MNNQGRKKSTERVVILLATFNGERYLKEQIESIQRQSYSAWTLLIRDDCSSDETLKIVASFVESDPRVSLIGHNDKNLGVIGNFGKLIEFSLSLDQLDYLFFADQDDVWLPSKLQLMVCEFERKELLYGKTSPQLVYSDLAVVSEDLLEISPSMMRYQGIRDEAKDAWKVLAVQNFVTGCSMAINRPLLQKIAPLPKAVPMHDWWIALCASVFGKIHFIDKPLVLYRQHARNEVGAQAVWWLLNPFRNNLLERWQKGQKHLLLAKSQVGLLLERLDHNHEAQELLHDFFSVKEDSKLSWSSLFGRDKIHRQGLLRHWVLYCRVFALLCKKKVYSSNVKG